MQLDLFDIQTTEIKKYPWIGIFDWEPKIGDHCQINSVVIDGYGYTYGLRCEIKSINPTIVIPVKDKWQQSELNEISCKITDLWPKIYKF